METLDRLRAGKLAGIRRLDLKGGLTDFPREILDLADSLEVLNLTGNHLRSLPDDFARLHRLRILFCSDNEFTHLPPVLGRCPHLSMIGFKSNHIQTVEASSLPESLRWLILTDNRIRSLPSTLGRCTRLQKLMLAGNRLSHLPKEMAFCTRLELIRLAANEFRALPPWLLSLPRLSWLSFAGNPCSSPILTLPDFMPLIPWSSLQLQEKLGQGASGTIHRARWHNRPASADPHVAVKLFKASVTSDGLPACEMAVSLAAGTHDHLIPVLGRLAQHPDGKEGLVMSLIDHSFTPLAAPPSFETCTRDVYPETIRFTPASAVSLAADVASAVCHLHSRGIMHGDLYAHNVLWHPQGRPVLGDFGAATSYPAHEVPLARALQGIEIRAFGCLLDELLHRIDWPPSQLPVAEGLLALQAQCTLPLVSNRPLFDEVERVLHSHLHDLESDEAA